MKEITSRDFLADNARQFISHVSDSNGVYVIGDAGEFPSVLIAKAYGYGHDGMYEVSCNSAISFFYTLDELVILLSGVLMGAGGRLRAWEKLD